MATSATARQGPARGSGERRSGLTWVEFLALPEQELKHAELVDGEVLVNPPSAQHQRVVRNLLYALETWCRADEERGEVTMEPPVQASADSGYQPDLAWYPPERCAPPGEPAAFENPPALVVEVLSPSTRTLDMVRKRADYARVGVDELWMVDSDESVAFVLRRADAEATEFELVADLGADAELGSPLLPGFAVIVGDLTAQRPSVSGG